MKIIEFVASVASCLALIFATITYFISVRREKTAKTYSEIDDLFEKYAELASKNMKDNYMDFVHFTRKVNIFAGLSIAGQFNKSIVKKSAGNFLVRIYNEKLSEIISQQRKQFKRENYFSQIEYMINDLKK